MKISLKSILLNCLLLLISINVLGQLNQRQKTIVEKSGKPIYKYLFTVQYVDGGSCMFSYNSLQYFPSNNKAYRSISIEENAYKGKPVLENFMAFVDVLENYVGENEMILTDDNSNKESYSSACGFAMATTGYSEEYLTIEISDYKSKKTLCISKSTHPEFYLELLIALAKVADSQFIKRNYNLNKNRIYLAPYNPNEENIIETAMPIIFDPDTETEKRILNACTFEFLNGYKIEAGDTLITAKVNSFLQSLQSDFVKLRKTHDNNIDSFIRPTPTGGQFYIKFKR